MATIGHHTRQDHQKYNLLSLEKDGWVYIEIQKGMYGLTQAVFLVTKPLEKRLSRHHYFPVQYTPGLWKHTWRPVTIGVFSTQETPHKYIYRHAQVLHVHQHMSGIHRMFDPPRDCVLWRRIYQGTLAQLLLREDPLTPSIQTVTDIQWTKPMTSTT